MLGLNLTCSGNHTNSGREQRAGGRSLQLWATSCPSVQMSQHHLELLQPKLGMGLTQTDIVCSGTEDLA